MNLDPYLFRLKKARYKKYVYFLTFVVVFDYLMFPLPILAKESSNELKTVKFDNYQNFKSDRAEELASFDEDKLKPIEAKPENEKKEVEKPKIEVANKKSFEVSTEKGIDYGYHTMTAYTSEAAQTDSSPCITANGFNVCKHGVEDTIAANFLKFGTKVRIPELFGDRVFVVRDRMNRRYPDRVDVWFVDKPEALRFGVKYAKIEVIK